MSVKQILLKKTEILGRMTSTLVRTSAMILSLTTDYPAAKVKSKVHPTKSYKGTEGDSLYLTSALEGCGWSTARWGRFVHGEDTRHPFYRKQGGSLGQHGRVPKKLASSGG
jgi:hypothetical protein